jgi:membrane protease YdiL (CAAX protease family)
MQNPLPSMPHFFRNACYFEASLIIMALILGQIADINPFESLYFSESAILYGLLGTLPLGLLFLTIEHIPSASLEKIRQLLLNSLCPYLHQHSWADLFMLAMIAGIGEEVLFRGVLQPWLERAWGMNAGLCLSSFIFGFVHALTPLYALLAGLVSVYLGLSLDYGESRNLLIPVVIHALYDFLVLLIILKKYRQHLINLNPQSPSQ